jgi:hypothetical protein
MDIHTTAQHLSIKLIAADLTVSVNHALFMFAVFTALSNDLPLCCFTIRLLVGHEDKFKVFYGTVIFAAICRAQIM